MKPWSQSKQRRSSTPSTHSSTSQLHIKARKTGRIVEEDFNPLVRQVAIAAKAHFRWLAIYDTPFPPQGAARFEYGWKAIKKMVKDSKNSQWQSALQCVKADSDRQILLVKFVNSKFHLSDFCNTSLSPT